METVLKIRNFQISYPDFQMAIPQAALKNGGLTVLLGLNGAGKSTLIQAISDSRAQNNGIQNPSGEKFHQEDIGVVFSQLPQPDYMRVEDLIALALPSSVNKEKEINKALNTCGITAFKQRFLNSLSDGQRQKAYIAMVLAKDSPILLFDEPLAYLDFNAKAEILSLLVELCVRYKKAVLLSIHDIELAERFGEHFWLLHNGVLAIKHKDEMPESGWRTYFK